MEPTNNLLQLRLYVVKSAQNSTRALVNLQTICEQYAKNNYQIEVVDLIQNPLQAIEDGILATPTLLKISPSPTVKIIGNLSQTDKVVAALGLSENSP